LNALCIICKHLLQEARAIKEECEAILAEALPALNAAISALDTIKKSDIQLVQVRLQ
jgi:dynein heavy chain